MFFKFPTHSQNCEAIMATVEQFFLTLNVQFVEWILCSSVIGKQVRCCTKILIQLDLLGSFRVPGNQPLTQQSVRHINYFHTNNFKGVVKCRPNHSDKFGLTHTSAVSQVLNVNKYLMIINVIGVKRKRRIVNAEPTSIVGSQSLHQQP